MIISNSFLEHPDAKFVNPFSLEGVLVINSYSFSISSKLADFKYNIKSCFLLFFSKSSVNPDLYNSSLTHVV